ncbi:uncharacterized protein F5Z01DRAFT_99322 [Emericellopsis atlantica]|uniref:Uncharacterized protein n=1 Tax=Emericellopsis atlantica TaxID=2614577 RepID=A0A9P8CPG9_9HYPO|nr:uncharacterized protein F5Z01DRAFT_99322 [Emericellopsis atlantica]KAG9254864.1 hypothetical protein F5Z01DRAFT_99322 [Emericellopsis atlantica]
MLYNKVVLAAAAATAVNAQRPSDESICDYYTTALLKENTAENQATLLTLVVNTVVIGNYTEPNVGIKVPGILAPGTVDGEDVNLMPYFSGELATTNRGGNQGVKVNFLDGGAAEPLKKNMPADDDSSNQYFLLTHLYQFFGSLLGCSMQGMSGFDAYMADPSMYEVHKFMNLNLAENTYFIQQVGMAAASFGVAEEDVTTVGMALNSLFNVRCAPPATAVKAQGPQLQSICIDEKTCPLADNADCALYSGQGGNSTTTTTTTPTSSAMPTATGGNGDGGAAEPTSVPGGAAVVHGLGLGALVAAVAAFAL